MNSEHPGGHNFQQTRTIFVHIQDFIKTNILTKKNTSPTGGHVFQPTGTFFELVQEDQSINQTINVASRFHDNRTINVASRVLTRKNAPPPGGKVAQPTRTILDFIQDIIRINLLTEVHEDRTINLPLVKNAPPPGAHVFQATGTISILVQDIIGTNLLNKFHDDRTINVASRVFTRFYHRYIKTNAPPPWRPCFSPTRTIFKLVQDIIGTNLLTKFHEDRTINVVSRVLTRKNAPSTSGHVFLIIQYIIKTNLLTKVLTRKNAPPFGGHVFQPTGIIFKLVQDIIGMNRLTKFHEDRTIIVASIVLTSHVFQANVTISKLIQYIIDTNHLTKCHEDWTINVASRVLTRQTLTQNDAQRTTDIRRSQKITMSTLCSCVLKNKYYW
ncbi:hypothetical protein DPMN_176779 [Dreissena polymorpha]|uniref:Uncharacterized protein n=1 Tax=Dreissena polymorpha TaxID=45954 RepID=A0A9D4E7J0_DREPO|nr:hypothetical protein DPMN_176779 [Dreissena polymorpha]